LSIYEELIVQESIFSRLIKKQPKVQKEDPKSNWVERTDKVQNDTQPDKYAKENQIVQTKYIPHLKKIQKELKTLANQPQYNIVRKGFIIPDIDDEFFEVRLCYGSDGKKTMAVSLPLFEIELWDIYPDARTRCYDDNTPEASKFYDDAIKIFTEYLKKNNLPGKFDEGGDWDSWFPEWVIPAKDIK